MSDLITVTGIVLSAMPIGEQDKRIVLLTKERGKITAFAKGARRTNSPFLAACNPFVLGSFSLYEGRSSYNLNQVQIRHHFTELANEQPGVYYGFYFLELADYYGREYTDEKEMINLLYVTLRALLNPKIDNELVRYIYELRTMAIQGECPQLFECSNCEEREHIAVFSQSRRGVLCDQCAILEADSYPLDTSVLYALQFIVSAKLERLYSFTVTPEVLHTLRHIVGTYTHRNTDKKFKSLEILKMMTL